MRYYYLYGEINEKTAKTFNRFARTNQDTEITIYIHSEGGEFEAACSIIDTILELKSKNVNIITVVDGKAYSAGAFIFCFGTTRIMQKHAILMFHAVYWSSPDTTVHDIKGAADFTDAFYRKLLETICLNCNLQIGEKELYDRLRNDWWLDHAEALRFGFATQ